RPPDHEAAGQVHRHRRAARRPATLRRRYVRGVAVHLRRKPREGGKSMSAVIEAPISMVQAVADLHLPPKADQRMQDLMDRHNNGALTPEEREQLETLVDLRSPKYLRNRDCSIARGADSKIARPGTGRIDL